MPETLLDRIKKTHASIKVKVPSWESRDGVELVQTQSGFGVRKDGEGRLISVPPNAYLRGRDEAKMRAAIRRAATVATERLLEAVEVDRDDVIGKHKKLQTVSVKKPECRFVANCERVTAPEFLFVTYRSPRGNVMARRVVE